MKQKNIGYPDLGENKGTWPKYTRILDDPT